MRQSINSWTGFAFPEYVTLTYPHPFSDEQLLPSCQVGFYGSPASRTNGLVHATSGKMLLLWQNRCDSNARSGYTLWISNPLPSASRSLFYVWWDSMVTIHLHRVKSSMLHLKAWIPNWLRVQDLNLWHEAYEAPVLPTELTRNVCYCWYRRNVHSHISTAAHPLDHPHSVGERRCVTHH